MASQTTTTKKDLTIVEPRENQLRERLGFDRRGIRRELAGVRSLDLTDKFVEQEPKTYLNPDTTDMPVGPSGMGETGGAGVEMMRVDGDAWPTYRFTHGFSVLEEDLRAGNATLQQQRDEVIEIFDFFADSMFLTGIEDRSGTQVKQGVFSWLKSAIPSARTFDCENFDGDSGDKDYTGVEENLIKYDAYSEVSGNLLNDSSAQWDLMLGRQAAISNFNRISGAEGGVGGRSYWQRLNDEDAVGGVSDFSIIPDQLQYAQVPDGMDPLTVDLTTELGSDEVILLPDMDAVKGKYWNLYEMDTPEAFEMHQQGGGQMRQDYAWRYTHEFNPDGHSRWAAAEDAIHLKNVSVLFN